MKGVPLRLEIGPKDMEKNQAVLARRDTGEKIVVSLDELETKIPELLKDIQANLLQKATERRDSKTYVAHNMEEFEKEINETPGFIKACLLYTSIMEVNPSSNAFTHNSWVKPWSKWSTTGTDARFAIGRSISAVSSTVAVFSSTSAVPMITGH